MKKVNLDVVMSCVQNLAEVIPFFPQGFAARALIASEIHCFVGTKEQLAWFEAAAVRQIRKYDGVPVFRALYCTKFEPSDGVAPLLDLPGFTTDELEAKARLREMEENDARLERYKQEALADGEPLKAFPLPDVKRLN